MIRNEDNDLNFIGYVVFISIFLLFFICIWWGANSLFKVYDVWASSKEGQAELSKADWNRQIAVREATAKMESASMLAQAEIIRAKGVAQANKIIGDSLKDNQEYLRYLYVNNMAETKNQIIYIPTEAGLPILETNRLINKDSVEKNK